MRRFVIVIHVCCGGASPRQQMKKREKAEHKKHKRYRVSTSARLQHDRMNHHGVAERRFVSNMFVQHGQSFACIRGRGLATSACVSDRAPLDRTRLSTRRDKGLHTFQSVQTVLSPSAVQPCAFPRQETRLSQCSHLRQDTVIFLTPPCLGADFHL